MNNSQLQVYFKKNTSKSPLIIFIHGAACDHTLWLYQTRYFFNKNFSVISMDLPGHGKNLSKPLKSIKELSNLIKKLIKRLPNKEIIVFSRTEHEIFMEKDIHRKKMWEKIDNFIN